MMDRTEMFRMAKAMQTAAIQQREALSGAASADPNMDAQLCKELHDAADTAQTHIEALQHIIVAPDAG